MQKPKRTLTENCTKHQFKLLNKSDVRPGFNAIMCMSDGCWYGYFANDEKQLCTSCFPGFTTDDKCVFKCQDPEYCDCTKCEK